MWHNAFILPGNIIVQVFFIMLITTAFFSTLDTYMITFSQFVHNSQSILHDTVWEKILTVKPRKSGILFVMIAFSAGIYIDPNMNCILGIFAASISIPLFYTMHIEKYLTLFSKRPVLGSFFVILPLTLLPYLVFKFNALYSSGMLVFPYIPISVATLYLMIIFFAVFTQVIFFRRH